MLRENAKIVAATISAMPQSLFDPMPEVSVTTEDGATEVLFSFYPDEIAFAPHEFVGLTVAEARELRHKKDVAYLRSPDYTPAQVLPGNQSGSAA